MNDKELLVFAAKAANLPLVDFADIENGDFWIDADGTCWNPLTEDGDALQLAVKLWIVPEVYKPECSVIAHIDAELFPHTTFSPREFLGDDPYAATRRAIVRAAAEIGKGMK